MRLFHPNMREIDLRGLDTRRFVERCAALNADGVVVSAGGIYAFYPSRVRYHHVSAYLDGRDFLKEVVEQGHAAGLRIIARVDFSKAREEVFRDHPDWFSRRADGSPSKSARFYQSCPNSPFANGAFAFPVVREILERYAVDGFHLNAGGFPGYCYCRYCKEKFREQFSADLPARADWKDATWKQFVAWRYDVSAAHFARLHTAMEEVRPGVFWTGELAGLDEPSWMRNRAYDIVRLARSCSSLMSTIDNPTPGTDMRWVTGMTASYARSMGNRPPIINLKAHIRDGGWPRASMPAAEYAMCAWQAIAHGAGLKMPIFGVPGPQEDERNLGLISEALGTLKKHAWVYEDARQLAPVALVWSHRTLEFYGQDDPKARYAENAYGLYAALVESHIPCVVVGDDWLAADRLKGFRGLVLPNLASMNETQCRAVSDFVRAGGGLLATHETSLYQDNGVRRGRLGLEEIVAARYEGLGTAPDVAPRGAYFYRKQPHQTTAWMRDALILPFGGAICPVRPLDGAAVPLVYAQHRNAGIPEEIDSPAPSETPLVIASAPGRGRVVYFPGEADKFYFRSRLPDIRRLLAAATAWVLHDALLLRTNAPAGVGLSVFEKPGYRFVHFVNALGRSPLDEVATVSEIEVSLEAPRHVRAVRALIAGRPLEFRQDHASLRFVLPRLGAYEVAVIEIQA